MKKNSFVEGTFIATFAIILIKILGALYVIPFYDIIGEQGGALYSYAYNVYNLFLNISTAGLPVAMSKIISEYNALEMYDAKERAYKLGRNIIAIISMIAFFLLFVFSKEFAVLILGDITGGNTLADVSFVIKSVSFCLLIIPFLSVAKGYLQGHKFIAPSSTSQVIEQIVRIAVILLGSYLAINIFNTSITFGVAIAVFGAFVGGLVAYLYVKRKMVKNNKLFIKPKKGVKDAVTNKQIIKKILTYAVPLIIVSVAIDIYSLTDMTLVLRGSHLLGYSASESETIASIISTWGVKICMIINSVAIGMCVSLMPNMVDSFVKKDYEGVRHRITQAVGIILVIAIPMAIGLSILSYPVYTIFYGQSIYGSMILKYLVYAAVAASLHMVINMALQSLNKYKTVYISTILGFGINAALDIPLMMLFDKIGIPSFYGAIAATIIGYIVSYTVAFNALRKEFKYKVKPLINIVKKMALPLVYMIIALLILNFFMPINSTNKLTLVWVTLVYTLVGAVIYLLLTYKNGLLYDVLGTTYVDKFVSKIKKIFRKK